MAIATSSLIGSSSPVVSVVMAVKDGADLVADAVQSILQQSFADFEFIIIDDGSKDDTLAILKRFSDPRIRIYSQENQGLARALNRGFSLSNGQYLARQDHDDVSYPTRLAKQLEFLERNPSYGLLGTAADIWNSQGSTGRVHQHPTTPGVLAFDLLFNNPFVHTAWMLPKAVIDQVGNYSTDRTREPPEDYELVSRIVRAYPVANLSERLVAYREVANSLSSGLRVQAEKNNAFMRRLATISAENLAFVCKLEFNHPDAVNFGALVHLDYSALVGEPNIQAIRERVRFAAKAIAKQYQEPEVLQALPSKLDLLTANYFMGSPSVSWPMKTQYRIKKKLRKLFSVSVL